MIQSKLTRGNPRLICSAILFAAFSSGPSIAGHGHGFATPQPIYASPATVQDRNYSAPQSPGFRRHTQSAPTINYQQELLRAMSARDWQAMILICEQAAKATTNPIHRSKWLHFLAVAYSRQGYWAASEYALRDALRWQPNEYPIQEALAVTLLQQRRYGTALDYLRSLPVAPTNSNRHLALVGFSAQQAGNYTVAAAAYGELMATMPNEGRWLLGFARALESQGKTTVATYSYRRAAKSPTMPPLLRRFALLRLAALAAS